MTQSTFTFRVETQLKEAFAEAARQQDRTGAQLIRDFMRETVRSCEKSEYDVWFADKVAEGREAVRQGRILAHEEVERQAKVRQAQLKALLEGER